MSNERRVFLVGKLIDGLISPEEEAELDELQRQPWEPKVEPPIDVKNEIRMGDLNGQLLELEDKKEI
jgi:hypothetical protein